MFLLLCLGTLVPAVLTPAPKSAFTVIVGGVRIESDPCLPPAQVDVIHDERRLIAIDAAAGSVTQVLEGELVTRTGMCGNIAMAVSEKNLFLYSTKHGKWIRQPLRQASSSHPGSPSYHFSLGQNHVAFSTLSEIYFFNGETAALQILPLNADRLRGVAAYNDAACVLTDRRVYCSSNKFNEAQTYALLDMDIRSAKALEGKIIMRAPEKTLIYYPNRNLFEYIPLR